jgi:hypothetical protein
MRRMRNGGPKVWHNPDVDIPVRGRPQRAAPRPAPSASRLALEALFAPKADGAAPRADEGRVVAGRGARGGRIVAAATGEVDPRTLERERLLARLLEAEGRPNITRAANDLVQAGFELPDQQAVQLQLLEHQDEAQVKDAIERLSVVLANEPPSRRAVLESRLRRIEEYADDPGTRDAARGLWLSLTGRRPVAAAATSTASSPA